ncbi:hypothetical protein A2U01_0034315 [Trifolium medium]|uniref:Retrotransposon gag protein n=1 Tax=Trifolium medium TaxID=97028 RepID=A0A392PNY0_9FABA|nr:hypothetical protein [Trifolium medium]
MPKRQQLTLQKMDAKVVALENEISEVRSSLAAVENAVKDMPGTLIAMLEKTLGKSLQMSNEGVQIQNDGDESEKTSPLLKEVVGGKGPGVGSSLPRGDPMMEFRQSAKKVELPSFDGDDPAGWISRAEIYFKVQGTSPEIKGLKDALLERYGGNGEGDVYEQLSELRQRVSGIFLTWVEG